MSSERSSFNPKKPHSTYFDSRHNLKPNCNEDYRYDIFKHQVDSFPVHPIVFSGNHFFMLSTLWRKSLTVFPSFARFCLVTVFEENINFRLKQNVRLTPKTTVWLTRIAIFFLFKQLHQSTIYV